MAAGWGTGLSHGMFALSGLARAPAPSICLGLKSILLQVSPFAFVSQAAVCGCIARALLLLLGQAGSGLLSLICHLFFLFPNMEGFNHSLFRISNLQELPPPPLKTLPRKLAFVAQYPAAFTPV